MGAVKFFIFALCIFAVSAAEIKHLHNQRVSEEKGVQNECGELESGKYSFTIESNSPNGEIGLMHIQHDPERGLPITSVTFHDAMNAQQVVTRNDNFRKWPCPELSNNSVQAACSSTFRMSAAQQELTGRVSWDRGHMTPVNPYRFHHSAMDNTFFCVNIAPQEPYTNQGPWNVIEGRVYDRTKGQSPGYVMTGLCAADSSDGLTEAGYRTPDCFFKLVCYKDGSNVRVVGWIGNNTLFHKDNQAAKDRRRDDTYRPRSQREVWSITGITWDIVDAWLAAEKSLLVNRDVNSAPPANICATTLDLPEDVADEWRSLMTSADETDYRDPFEFYDDLS